MITEEFKNQRIGPVLKEQALFEPESDFEPVIPQLAQASTAMKVWLPDQTLGLGNASADQPPIRVWLGADFTQQPGLKADCFQASCFGSNFPLKVSYFPLPRRTPIRALNFSHSSDVTPYS